MPVSRRQNALREYRRRVWRLLRKYGVDPLCKDCTEAAVLRAHRSLLKKVHPDKGGSAEDFRVAHEAKVVPAVAMAVKAVKAAAAARAAIGEYCTKP